jgi:hypothetical protein
MSYLINPVIFPWQLNINTAQCLAGGPIDIPQFVDLQRDQYYIIVGIPVLYYKFNTVDFDVMNILLQNRASSTYLFKLQIGVFNGQNEGCLMQNNVANGMNDTILEADRIVANITNPPTVGNGSIQINGFAQVVNIF